ncbi:MAG: phage major capsid protein [Ruminococcus sp.]|nr:phage major capsid protein [Ruminococcus sp.]
MATKTTSSTLFRPELTQEIISKVKGHSTLAKLCGASPMPFAGTETFVFTMDGEVSIVGEGGNKPAGEADLKPVIIQPYKFIYQHRVTDEFVHLSEEKQLPYLSAFSDGFAKKIARGLDIAAIHGLNPATKTASSIIGNNCFDKAVTNIIKYNPTFPDDNIDDAVKPIQDADGIVTGIAMSPVFGSVLGKMKTADSHIPIYPEYRFGNNPENFGGMNADINNTVSFNSSDIRAIVGDFANCFRWGYADNIPLEIIEYGNPDGQGDLKQSNEIVLRSEAYIGWGILDKSAFSLIKAVTEEDDE